MEAPTPSAVDPNLAKSTNPILLSACRHALTSLAAILVADGYASRSSGQILVSVLLFLIVATWGIFEKTATAKKFDALIQAALPEVEEALESTSPGFIVAPDASAQAKTAAQNSSPFATTAPGAGNGPAPGSLAGSVDAEIITWWGLAILIIAVGAVFIFSGCASSPSAAANLSAAKTTIAAVQNNPGTQAAETAGLTIAADLTGYPEFAFLAPVAVNGLTAVADGSNPIAVTGNATADAQLITSTVSAAIPNSAGKTAAGEIAQAYTAAMSQPGVPQTATSANAIIAAIAAGLTKGASK